MIIVPDVKITTNSGMILTKQGQVAIGYIRRLLGLMFRKTMPADSAMVFYWANSIHTCFMRFSIDAVFLTTEGKVLKVCNQLKPWRFAGCWGAMIVVELPAGTLSCAGVKPGDILTITCATA